MKSQAELVVIGAGVAGLSAAIAARRAGLDVTVLEREDAPSPRPGETLHPGAQAIFKELALLDAIGEVARIRPLGLEVVGRRTDRVFFGGPEHNRWRGYQVGRDRLSDIMIVEALNLGVSLNFGARVAEIDATSDHVVLELGSERLMARWCCDATGAAQLSSRKQAGTIDPIGSLKVIRYRYDPQGSVSPDWPRLVLREEGWLWEAMVDEGRYAFVELVRGRFTGGREPGWNYADGTWRISDAPATGRVFRVGDAAGRVDPSAGRGILRSMMSAMMMVHLIRISINQDLPPGQISAFYSHWFRDWIAKDARELQQLLGF